MGGLPPKPSMETHNTIQQVATDGYGKLLAIVASKTWDLALAEDALGEAFHAALRQWPIEGLPRAPEAWLLSVARRRLMDEHRRHQTRQNSETSLEIETELAAIAVVDELADLPVIPDERLKLLFVCAHPAIDPGVRTPLMLQVVLGLDAARIASAFLVAPSAMGQRLVRAKTKIRAARIPFRIPEKAEWPERIEFILEAIYAAYGTGWEDVTGMSGSGLSSEAISLARVLVCLVPDEPEALGLLALLLHCEARQSARRDLAGNYVPLAQQDTALWNRPLMEEAEALLHRASTSRQHGRFQLEAAIQSAHAHRAVTGKTNWPVIVTLYRELLLHAPSIGGHVAYAAALHQSGNSQAALDELSTIPQETVTSYQPYWAVTAHALLGLKRLNESRAAFQHAAGLTQDEATRRFLLQQCPPEAKSL